MSVDNLIYPPMTFKKIAAPIWNGLKIFGQDKLQNLQETFRETCNDADYYDVNFNPEKDLRLMDYLERRQFDLSANDL